LQAGSAQVAFDAVLRYPAFHPAFTGVAMISRRAEVCRDEEWV